MPARLTASTLSRLAAGVQVPSYDRAAVTPGIVHLGVGVFHRAHQAVYVDALLRREPGWAIVGASLRSPDTADALLPQDCLYTVASRDAGGAGLRVVGSIVGLMVAPREREALLARLADPAIRLVTLTVTEKGYCHDPATGELAENHPDIRADLANPHEPVSAPGLIVEALARRRAAGLAPFTALSCDNLPANGRTLQRIVNRFAALRDGELGRFVTGEVAFPCSMVDRIVPFTTDEDRRQVAAGLGGNGDAISDANRILDAWPIVTEPFTQWVIEDHFPTGRPDFAAVGAEMVADVAPFERMKLRMLNGSHSTLAHLALLAGLETVADAMAAPALRRLVADMMTQEVMPTLVVPGADLGAYRDALIRRFENPALRHKTAQIVIDGSQKLPQRLLFTIRDRLAAGAPIERLALGIAGWMRFVQGEDEQGRALTIKDPMADRFATVSKTAGGDVEALAAGLMAVAEIFGDDLPRDPRFREPVTRWLKALFADGAAATVRRAAAL